MSGKLIYFMRPVGQIGPIKIGCSKHPEGRLDTFLIWSPLKLEVIATAPGTHAIERKLHSMFAKHWLHHEWFAASKELLALVDYVTTHGVLPALPEGKVVALPRRPRSSTGPQPASEPRGPTQRTIDLGLAAKVDYEAGATLQEVATKYDVHPNTIRRALVAVGVALRRYTSNRERCVLDATRAEEFKRRYLAGDTLEAIGRDHGVTRERVRQILRKTNVPSLGLRAAHRSRPRPLTPEMHRAAEMYEAGIRPKKIVEETGLTYSQIATVVKRLGIETKGNSFWLTRPDDAEITARVVELYAAGVGPSEITRRVPEVKFPPTVYRYLKRAGVSPRYERGRRRELRSA